MTQVVRLRDVPVVAEPDNHLTAQAVLTAADGTGALSVTRVVIDGRHRRLRTDRSTRVYVALAGELLLTAGTAPAVRLAAGDTATLPPGTPYALAGRATYLVINAPAFRDGDDVYEEQP